jgi:hypothetical protein
MKKLPDNQTPQNITQHLTNIYSEKEVDKNSTCKDFLQAPPYAFSKVF